MTIKKQYQELVTFLEANKNKKVSSILEDIVAMTEAKVQTQTHIRNANDEVIAIFCYFHKQWELLEMVEYGAKKSSSTGLNTMCKQGVRGWTKTQKEVKAIPDQLLNLVMSGELDASELVERKATLEIETKERLFVEYALEATSYATLEGINEMLEKEKA